MLWGEVPMSLPTAQHAGSPPRPNNATSESRPPRGHNGDWCDEWLDALLQSSGHSSQHPTPPTDPVCLAPQVDSSAISSPEPYPLDFVMTTVDDAVSRINGEYFFRRDTSEI